MVACHDDEALFAPEAGGVDVYDAAGDPGRDGVAFDVHKSDVAADTVPSDAPAACFDLDDAGTWTAMMAIDTRGCEMRPVVVCGASALSLPEEGLRSQLLRIAKGCGLPAYTYVQVAFTAGCPSGVRLRDAIGRPIPGALSPCLVEALKSQRWDCALGLPCVTLEYDTLP